LDRSPTSRTILAKADRLVVPSEFLVAVFREFGLTAQAVPNVVDVTQFRFRQRNPLRPRLLCTRGFHPYYCVDLLVQAFAEVQRELSEAQLSLVGTGPLEKEIRDLVEQRKLTGVVFSGAVSREQVARFYDAADIFVNASSLDNMPVSILEAFAAGTPVVSTAPEGIRYLVEHERTGLLSEPGDGRALAENVMRLLRDPELAGRLASNAYEQAKQYRWAEVRGQWLQIYRSLAKDGCLQEDSRALEGSRAMGE
jgi:glycosyltransferase involved in cell wall biosynthesis